jgi:Carboxypeptidase regulatory-like domain
MCYAGVQIGNSGLERLWRQIPVACILGGDRVISIFYARQAKPSMSRNEAKFILCLGALLFCLAFSNTVSAQISRAAVSGTITSPAGQAVPEAKVSLKNLATGQSSSTQSGSSGNYSFSDLPPGEYEISISAAGFSAQTDRVTLASGAKQILNLKLTSALSLSSLGFSTAQTQGNAKEQALLNKRSHMLQIHQKLGLITAFPLTATVITGFLAGGRNSDPAHRDLHIGLGSATAGLYAATAYYAIFAPKVAGVHAHGPIRFHKAMAWIHGPGMILTPLAGAMAESQLNQGERLHGIAKYHGDIAVVTAVAYGLALISETKPDWIPGLGHHVAALFPFHHHGAESAAGPTIGTEDAEAATNEGRRFGFEDGFQ